MNIYKKKWCAIALAAPLGLASIGLHAEENSSFGSEFKDNDYRGFYLYGQLGHAESDISDDEIENGLQRIDPSIETSSIKDGGAAWSVGAGYFLNNWLSAELGWLDLGDRSVSLDGNSTFPSSGYDYYPQSGKGVSLALIGHIPVVEHLYFAPKIGAFAWKDDNVHNDNDGTDLWYGAEFNYSLDKNVSIFAGWQQFDLPRQNVDLFSIGLRYRFASKNPNPIREQSPTVRNTLVEKTALDSDGDGVLDSQDQCPNTPEIYQVDNQGCTLFEEELLEYRLIVNYENDSADVDSQYDTKIKELFQFMTKHDINNIYVEGHASAPGEESYNQALSLRRAKSVINVLSSKYNIDENVFIPVGKGETQFLDNSATALADRINRRTEVVVGKTIKKEVLR